MSSQNLDLRGGRLPRTPGRLPRKTGLAAGLVIETPVGALIIQRLDAAQRRRRDAQSADRDTHIVQVVVQVERPAVIIIYATGGRRAPVIVRAAAGIAAPLNLDDEVIFAVIIEGRRKREAEPTIRRSVDVLGAVLVNFDGRFAAVVPVEIPGQCREGRMTHFDAEIVVRARAHGRTGVPFALRKSPRGYLIRAQNQVLAPYGINPSTSAERVRSRRALAADRKRFRIRRTGRQRTYG